MGGEIMAQSIYDLIGKNYPDTVGRYVVSESLLNNELRSGGSFAQQMAAYIGRNMPNTNAIQPSLWETGNLSINNAMSFLQKVINNERAKEQAFINYIQNPC